MLKLPVVASQTTGKKCAKMKNARAGPEERAEIIVFAHEICSLMTSTLSLLYSLRKFRNNLPRCLTTNYVGKKLISTLSLLLTSWLR